MQKRLRTIATLAAAAFAIVGDAANIPQEWAVEVSRVRQYQFQATHGDTMELKATFWHNGEPFDLGGDTFRLYWQTNDMGSVYWSAPATASSNTVSAVFANTMDPGAPIVYGFLGATSGNYRASFSIRYAPGPGAVPNALPLPAATIDFAKVEVLNPPYYTKAETEEKIIELSPVPDLSPYATKEGLAVAASSATNYTDSTASTLRADISAAATLTPIYSDTPTFSEWTFDGTEAGLGYHWEVEWDSGDQMFYLYRVADSDSSQKQFVAAGGESEDETVVYFNSPGGEVIATRTRTYAVIGYQLGDQSDKPLQPMGNYAPATNITKSALAQDVQASLAKADAATTTNALQDAELESHASQLSQLSQSLDGKVPTSRTINGKALSSNISLSASDVGALGNSGNQTLNGLLRVYLNEYRRDEAVLLIGSDTYGLGLNPSQIIFFDNGIQYTIEVPPASGTLALTSDIPSVAGQTFNFATTQGVMDALKTVIEALGGTVTNAPSAAISQGE